MSDVEKSAEIKKQSKKSNGRGGYRPRAGRKPGAVSKLKREIAGEAQAYASVALTTLAEIAENGEKEAARVSAAIALLDRGYGKPHQAVELQGAGGGPMVVQVEFVAEGRRVTRA